MEEIKPIKPKSPSELALESLAGDKSYIGLDTVKRGVLDALINSLDFQNSALEITHRTSIALSTVKITLGRMGVQEPLRECTDRFRKSVDVALRFSQED